MAKVHLTISVESDSEEEKDALMLALRDMLRQIGQAVDNSPGWTWQRQGKAKRRKAASEATGEKKAA